MIVLNNELIQKTDSYIDDDKNHKTFSNLGESFFDRFSYDKRNNRISTQVRNLQQIVCSATRFADIEDFVKNQMGKDSQNAPKWRALGGDVLKQLKQLRDKSQELDADSSNQMALRLRLCSGAGCALSSADTSIRLHWIRWIMEEPHDSCRLIVRYNLPRSGC